MPSEERFSIVCEDANLYAMFEQFLVTQFSVENLHFYNEVRKLHDLTDPEEVEETATRLCEEYFGLNSSEALLNVSESIREQILKDLKQPTTTMFDNASLDIEQVLKVRYIAPPAPR